VAARVSTLEVGLAIGVAVPLAVAVLMMVALDMLLEADPVHLVVTLAELRVPLDPLTPLESYSKLLTVEVSPTGARMESLSPPSSPLTPSGARPALAQASPPLSLGLQPPPPPPPRLPSPAAARCTDWLTG